jgi:hypothetical protein
MSGSIFIFIRHEAAVYFHPIGRRSAHLILEPEGFEAGYLFLRELVFLELLPMPLDPTI